MKTLLRLASVVIVLSAFALQAGAQTSSAAITGHVTDASNAAIQNAEVKLTNQETQVVVTTRSNATGDFIFPSVQPGTFTVAVEAQGFKSLQKVDLVLSASQNLSAGTFILEVGQVTESLTISADITPLQSSSSERSGVIDTAQMDNLLAIGRDAMALTRLIPGVVGSEGSSSLGTSSTPTVNGVNSEYNLATIDGVTGNTRGLATLDTPVNMDAIEEVTLMGSNYQAQYGKTAGANFNFVTKSGTQKYHGALYYYFRNEDLNANTWVNNHNNQPRAQYRYNTLGGTAGGPVYWPGHFNRNKDKLFFFVAVEYSPIKQPDGLKLYRVPTLAETNGDFSQTYNQGTATQTASTLIRIKNPSSTSSCSVNSATPGAGCFANNQIPANLINSQGQLLLKTIYNNTLALNPGFAVNNLAVSSNNYNYVTNYSADKPVNQEIFRIDYFPTQNLHMFGRGDLTAVNNNGHSSPANNLPWLMPVNYRNTEPNFVFNLTYTFNPTVINEFNIGTAGWSETQLYKTSDLAKVTLGSGTGLTLPSLYAGVNPMNLFPQTSFGGVTNAAKFGWDSRFPMGDQVRSYELTDNVTKVMGGHTFKFGIDAGTDAYLQPNKNRVGTFAFDRDTKNPNDSNLAYSNALLGNLDTYTQTTQLLNYDPRTNAFEFYEQDTWKMNTKLTLDLGVRQSWAMAQRLHAGNNFVPSLYDPTQAPTLYSPNSAGKATDPTTGTATYPAAYAGLFVPGTGNLNNGVLFVNTKGYPQGTTYGEGLLWAPRVGFAYSPQGNTVIRGGFGIFNNVRARSGQEGDLTNNAPTTNSPKQYYTNINSASSGYYVNAGNLNGPFSVSHAIPLHSHVPYAQEASLGIQRQVRAGMVLDLAYVGTFTKHVSNYTPINEIPYNSEFRAAHQYKSSATASATLPDNFFRAYPGFGDISLQNFNLTSNYNALQFRVTRRFHNGLEFGGAYTYSRAMDYGQCSTTESSNGSTSCNNADSYNFTVARYQNLRTWNYGPSSFDRRHNLVINYLWSIPRGSELFGDSSRWNNFATRAIMNGWQVSGIASYISGAPSQILASISSGQNITGGGDGSRVVLTCDPWRKTSQTRSSHQWFNASCVAPPIAGSVPVTGFPDGKDYSTGIGAFSPKVNYFNPGITNFDTALFKNMPIREGVRLQLRVETYNTFNHSEFNAVGHTATFANANVQDATNPQTSSTFGTFTDTERPRQMQLALRFEF